MRWGVLLLLSVGLAAPAADAQPPRKSGSRQPVQTSKCNDVPVHPFDLILGRPTSNSVTVSVLCYQDTEGCIAYGPEEGRLATQTPTRSFRQGEPVEIVLTALQPNTRYFYQYPLGANEQRGVCLAHRPSAGERFHVHRDRGFPPGRKHRPRDLPAHARRRAGFPH